MNKWMYQTSGVKDDLFSRGKVPMTKSEVRAVTLSKLKLHKGLSTLDIGAGTGSVSIEMALQGCHVLAVERNPEGVSLIKANIKNFDVNNVEIIEGFAPVDLPKNKAFDRVFIGGSGGKLDAVFEYLDKCLVSNGILVANTITIENTHKLLKLMQQHAYESIEMVQLNVSRSKGVGPYTMMMAENPITIISAVKTIKKDGIK